MEASNAAKAPEVLMEFYGDRVGEPNLEWADLRSQYQKIKQTTQIGDSIKQYRRKEGLIPVE